MLNRPLLLGFALGLAFGLIDLLLTWLDPLQDDSIPALLTFYGPMFLAWAFVSYRAARRGGHLWPAIRTGAIIAFGTFTAFYVMNLLRVNVFLTTLTAREDWQNLTARFHASESASLRQFVNLEYLKGAPFKIGVASVIGVAMGLLGGGIGRLAAWTGHPPQSATLRR
jgi:hypothetical protein